MMASSANECDTYCVSKLVNCEDDYAGYPDRINACKTACLDCRYPLRPCNCVNTESSGLPVSVQQNISETIVSNISTENYVTSTIDRGNDAPILTDDWIALILSGVLFIIACLLCCYLCRLKKKRADNHLEYDNITSAPSGRGPDLSPYVGYEYPKISSPSLTKDQKQAFTGDCARDMDKANQEPSKGGELNNKVGSSVEERDHLKYEDNSGKNAYFEMCLN